VAVLGDEHAAERGHGRMRVGESVDAAMVHDAVVNGRREAVVQRPFHEVAGEVPDQRFGGGAGEEQMCEVIHERRRCSQPRIVNKNFLALPLLLPHRE
jgi:hypothetical protein